MKKPKSIFRDRFIGCFGFLLFAASGLVLGWVRGIFWLKSHPDYDQSEDILVCYIDAAVGMIIGILLGSVFATILKLRSEKKREIPME